MELQPSTENSNMKTPVYSPKTSPTSEDEDLHLPNIDIEPDVDFAETPFKDPYLSNEPVVKSDVESQIETRFEQQQPQQSTSLSAAQDSPNSITNKEFPDWDDRSN